MLSSQTLSPGFVFYGTATLFLEKNYSLVTSAKRGAILFLFGCSEVNSTWLITSELANQRVRKAQCSLVWYILIIIIIGSCGGLHVAYISTIILLLVIITILSIALWRIHRRPCPRCSQDVIAMVSYQLVYSLL